AARTRVGGGWNTYSSLTSAGDLTGDSRPDLIARDSAGVLWLYQGTGSASAPYAARTRVGGGWNTYSSLTSAGDLTGDSRPDLIARDSAGVLWLYQGTGNASAPYAARTRVGGGWNTYNVLS
ncbi:VCBS repeat-containing protein, partial [Streptomyces sp. RM72]|uniref:FG-GAP repeat domain-containing protein n=1 Tax=Streptomyces sp. RM72 TaxID=1115510 RepID=UPI001B37E001